MIFGLSLFYLGQTAMAQDRIIIPYAMLIGGDTLIIRGDSLLIEEPVREIFWKTAGNYCLNIEQVAIRLGLLLSAYCLI